ncbi:hypothetical protein BJ165DRAFT_1531487 [Panaeolus papilionaceus]|nr:hypothetical protein BJ165DRAFT_1531487 [Panaeolus papilionaceus]
MPNSQLQQPLQDVNWDKSQSEFKVALAIPPAMECSPEAQHATTPSKVIFVHKEEDFAIAQVIPELLTLPRVH